MILIRLIVSPILIAVIVVVSVLLSVAGGLVWICTGEPWTISANYPNWR